MKQLLFILLLLGIAACDRGGVPQRGGADEGSAAQSAGGVRSDEGKAARSAGR